MPKIGRRNVELGSSLRCRKERRVERSGVGGGSPGAERQP